MTATPQAKIRFDDVSKTFALREGLPGERFTALSGVSLDIAAGDFVCLVGPSGCGKSTLLDLLGGLATPDAGQVLVDGKPITGPGLDRGIVFQQYALYPWRTALGNVEFGLEAKGIGRRERASRAREYLDLVGLGTFADRYPHELSGGMKQRVAIARSLAFDPDILLMDEPFAALDAQTRESLQDELVRIWQRTGKTIVFITHGIDEAVFLGRKVAVMTSRPGRILTVLDVDLPHHDLGAGAATSRADDVDVRSTPEFIAYRHQVWELLHAEVRRAQAAELGRTKEVVPVG
ncbi:MAG: ABC transporter ATP-binding protein [Kineosporiaceae bacterium]